MRTLTLVAVPALLATGTAIGLFTTGATGLQDPGMPAPTSPAMLKAEEARELMGRVIGTWDIQGESFGPGGQSEFTLKGRCVWQWAMGGVFAIGDTLLSNGSAVLQEVDCLGFNAAGGTFQRTVMTDHDRAMIWQQGTWDAQSRRFTMQSVGAIPTASGTPRKVATIVDLSRDDAMTFTTSYFEGGQLVGTFRLACTRAQPGEQEQNVIPGLPTQAPTMAGGGLDANALQGQLNQMVATKQKLQGQIEDWKKRVKPTQASFDQLTAPPPQ
jgi:Protein of unknown function (DUF1579)